MAARINKENETSLNALFIYSCSLFQKQLFYVFEKVNMKPALK